GPSNHPRLVDHGPARSRCHRGWMRYRLILVALVCARCACDTTPTDVTPPMPGDEPTSSDTTMTFAVSSLLLGETTRAGALETWAWKKYGYDLDGLTTTKDSTNVCTLHMGAPATNQVDGDGGVDNAFGALILPIIQVGTSIQIPSDNATKLIASGAWTLQIEVRGLSGDANQTATGLE